MMTRKDYIAMSDILRQYSSTMPEEFDDLVEDIADYLAEDNPRFMRRKFLEACGIPE
jgi:hypothetical protein